MKWTVKLEIEGVDGKARERSLMEIERCGHCHRTLRTKGYYQAFFRSVFGKIPIRVRRLLSCPCQGEKRRSYLLLEILVCVFTIAVFATLAFSACALILLAQKTVTRIFRTTREAADGASQLVVCARDHALKGGRNPLLADLERPLMSANAPPPGQDRPTYDRSAL